MIYSIFAGKVPAAIQSIAPQHDEDIEDVGSAIDRLGTIASHTPTVMYLFHANHIDDTIEKASRQLSALGKPESALVVMVCDEQLGAVRSLPDGVDDFILMDDFLRYYFVHQKKYEKWLDKMEGLRTQNSDLLMQIQSLRANSDYHQETGLYNQSKMLQTIETSLAHCHRTRRPIAFISVVRSEESKLSTKMLGEKLKGLFYRSLDTVGIMDDNLFIIALPETDKAGLESVMNRLHEALGENVFTHVYTISNEGSHNKREFNASDAIINVLTHLQLL